MSRRVPLTFVLLLALANAAGCSSEGSADTGAQNASAPFGVAVSGSIAISIDDVGRFTDLTADELQSMAADVAQRADDAGFSMPVLQPS